MEYIKDIFDSDKITRESYIYAHKLIFLIEQIFIYIYNSRDIKANFWTMIQ